MSSTTLSPRKAKPLPCQTGVFIDTLVLTIHRFRGWFWTADDGKVYINPRCGTKVIEIAKGKSSIEVGEKRQLMPVIEALKKAVMAGELGNHVDATGAEVSKSFLKVGRQ